MLEEIFVCSDLTRL